MLDANSVGMPRRSKHRSSRVWLVFFRPRYPRALLAHVLVNKYADHLPLYRQSQIFEREAVDLGPSTLADWVGKSAALLEPLANAIQRHALSGQAIFADDTPVKLLSPGAGKTKTARLWVYVRDEDRRALSHRERSARPVGRIPRRHSARKSQTANRRSGTLALRCIRSVTGKPVTTIEPTHRTVAV